MKIGLVLSGGGARGFAHLGAIKAFEELNIPIHAISGSSTGAFMGSLYAHGYGPEEIKHIILSHGIYKNLRFSWSKMGLFNFKKIETLFQKYLPSNSFESLKIPMYICSTNLIQGQAVYFSKGDIIKPILASCAIPGIFDPVKIEGKLYMDGGVVNNLPIEPIDVLTDVKIGVNLMPNEKLMPVKSAKNISLKCMLISIAEQITHKEHKFDLLINPKGFSSYSAFKTATADELFALGHKEALRSLEPIKLKYCS